MADTNMTIYILHISKHNISILALIKTTNPKVFSVLVYNVTEGS